MKIWKIRKKNVFEKIIFPEKRKLRESRAENSIEFEALVSAASVILTKNLT